MYENEVSYFKSVYDKNIILYGKQTFYEELAISDEELFKAIHRQQKRGLDSTQPCFGVRLGVAPRTNGVVVIIFERISFSVENLDLLQKTISRQVLYEDERLSVDAIFVNCKFMTPLFLKEPVRSQICFKDCVFERDVILRSNISGKLIFNRCKFHERLDFEKLHVIDMLHIEESWFGKNSIINLNELCAKPSAKFAIKDTQFAGRFEAQKAKISCVSKFVNISFLNMVDIKGIKLNSYCIFENIAFAHPGTQQILDAQKDLAKELERCGCEKEIANLGLNIGQNIDDTEEREYQDALQKGWLNPKQAARFLGKSVRTLQEKRKNDQMKITKESLPFIGEGKDILYPLDALKAYLEQDWNLLKELRKKHWKKD